MKKLIKRIISRIIIYAVILTFTFYAFKLILNYFNLPYTDIDNNRYLLSAMAQSQAAIIAIVITVSLVAVQLAASTYSPRVVDIFKSNPDFWLLLSLYAGSVLYDSLILMILSERISTFYIFISYWLCSSAVLALFPYMLSMINILSPEAIIRKLLDDIDCESSPTEMESYIVGTYSLVYHQHPERDIFQPIIDIVRGAFIKGDYKTAKIGLRMMTGKVIGIINSYNIKKYQWIPGKRKPYNPYIGFSEHYCDILEEIGKFFAERDEELALRTLLDIGEVAKVITKKKLGTERDVVDALGRIGKTSAQKGFQTAAKEAMDIIATTVRRLPCDLMMVPKEYEAPEYRYPCRKTIEQALHAFRDISIIAVKKWGAYELQPVSRNLEKVGIKIAMEVDKWKYVWELSFVARTFNIIGIIALNIEKNPTQITDVILYDRVTRPLKGIASIVSTPWYLFSWDEVPGEDEKRFEEFLSKVFGIIVRRIEKVDNDMTIKVNDPTEVHGVNYLSLKLNSEKTEVKLEIDDGRTATFYVKSKNGKLNIYRGNEKLIIREDVLRGFKEFVFALCDVGSYAAIRGFNKTVHESAKALAEIAVLDEEVVEEELNNLKHHEANICSSVKFQKFVETYRNQLKELRVLKDGGQNKEQFL